MGQVLKVLLGILVGLALFVSFAVFVLQIPMPWKVQAQTRSPATPRAVLPITLVEGKSHQVEVPQAVARSLGILQGDKDSVAVASAPKQPRPLVMLGSTALDPARIMRIRARFAPAEVVSIVQVEEKDKVVPSMKAPTHELRPGDEVTPGMELGVFNSPDAGNKKNDLFEAIVQMRLDEVILKKCEDAGGVLPDVYLWTARRNVDTDRSAVRRARNTLLTWGVDPRDIDAVVDEAKKLSIAEGRRLEMPEGEWTEKHDRWARIVLKAPDFPRNEPAVVIERNVTKGEVVVDNTVNLFTLARVDKLLVYANCPEDDLPELYRLRKAGLMKWTVQTVGTESKEGVEGTITEIGWQIDPNQHTAVIKGYITNPEGKIRAGQFATVTVELLAPKDVVEIPIEALVEDGRQSVVFVQTDARLHRYQMRRVEVVNRFEKSVLVRSKPFLPGEDLTDEEKKQDFLPREALKEDDKVLTAGVLELKAAVTEKEAARRSEAAQKK
jgi:cobalt-zinc-cadmium efflux system membrane fusion protein